MEGWREREKPTTERSEKVRGARREEREARREKREAEKRRETARRAQKQIRAIFFVEGEQRCAPRQAKAIARKRHFLIQTSCTLSR